MVDVNKVGSIQLDTSIYNKPQIKIFDKKNFILHTITPRSEAAWELFVNLNINLEKEKRKNK